MGKKQNISPAERLYNGLVKEQLYTKSFDEFQRQFESPESAQKLHAGLQEQKLYTKSFDDFQNQFGLGLKKKKESNSQLPSGVAAPEPSPYTLEGQIDPNKPMPKVKSGVPKALEDQQYQQLQQDTEEGNFGIKSPVSPGYKPGVMPDVLKSDEKRAKDVVKNFQAEITGKYEPESALDEFTADLSQVAPSFNKGALTAVSTIPKGFAILTKGVSDLLGVKVPEAKELASYKLGDWLDKKAEEIGVTALDEKRHGFLNSTLPQAFGQMIGMMMTGGTSAEGNAMVQPTVAQQFGRTITSGPALSGALQSAVPEYEAAKKAGKSDSEAFSVFLKNIPGGLTEVVPVANMFTRLNKMTGSGILNAIKQGTAQSLEEGTQEAVQQYLTNKVAQGTYDPKRDLKEGMLEGAGAGFIVGFVMPGVMGAMQNMSTEERSDTKKMLLDYLQTKNKDNATSVRTDQESKPQGGNESESGQNQGSKNLQLDQVKTEGEGKNNGALEQPSQNASESNLQSDQEKKVGIPVDDETANKIASIETKLKDFYKNAKGEKPKEVTDLEKEIKSLRSKMKIPVNEVFKLSKKEKPSPDYLSPFVEKEIDVNKIVPTQDAISKNYVPTPGDENPSMIKVKDKYFVSDGHHRIADQILKGADKVKVRVRYTNKTEYDRESATQAVREPVQQLKEEPKESTGKEPVRENKIEPVPDTTEPAQLTESKDISKSTDVFKQAFDMHESMNAAESRGKKTKIKKQIQEFLKDHPSVQKIYNKLPEIYKHLEEKGIIKRKGDCP